MSNMRTFGSEKFSVTKFLCVEHGTKKVTISMIDSGGCLNNEIELTLTSSEAKDLGRDLISRAAEIEKGG